MSGTLVSITDCLESVAGISIEQAALPRHLADLLASLGRWESNIPVRVLADALSGLQVTIDQLRPFIRGSEANYFRNAIAANEHFQALVICWLPGQFSPIHDHGGSACTVRVIQGLATETVYRQRSDGFVEPLHSHDLTPGQVTAADDADIHALGNLAGNELPLVTFHIYSPPIANFNTYHAASEPRQLEEAA